MSWTLRPRSAALVAGDPITDFRATLISKWNLPGTLEVTGRRQDLAALLSPDVGASLTDDRGARRFAGIPTELRFRSDTCTVTYASDLIRLWDRDVYPTPSASITAQTTDLAAVRSGPAETVILGYINDNAGPGALAARRVTGLTVPASLGRGGTISNLSARLDSLGRLVADVAEAGALRIAVEQSGTTLAVAVATCPDLTASARYGTGESGGLAGLIADGWDYALSRPALTVALVAGGGVGTSRVFRERTDAAALALWGRIEAVIDQRQTSNTAELDKAGDDALREGAKPVEVKATILDDPDLRLGVEVPLGALVTLDLGADRVVDRVREITTTLGPGDGQPSIRTEGVVGSSDAGLTRDQKEWIAARKALRKVVRQ